MWAMVGVMADWGGDGRLGMGNGIVLYYGRWCVGQGREGYAGWDGGYVVRLAWAGGGGGNRAVGMRGRR